ncbi:RNA ligase family protein [Pseudomonas silesiensis]|uniref:RNA ligase family protein n=1 Tax=Pseudomonas silesiensis TaxID=1853130 RepID=UPI0009ED9143|nr:RNA ligase family protein [Pseudomonas silesiensis]
MRDFFRFPHTPHLKWLAPGIPRGDKVLSDTALDFLLEKIVIIEEKLDGANLGISLASDGQFQIQNRGQYLVPPYTGQFSRLPGWLMQHGEKIRDALKPGQIIFGEWCAARHSLDYTRLPDWFLVFDIFDNSANQFQSCVKRNNTASKIGLYTVPCLFTGHVNIKQLEKILMSERSRFRHGKVEGLIVRRDSEEWCEAKAKLVRPDFTQAIEEHWRTRPIEWNSISR